MSHPTHPLYSLLQRLELASISFSLSRYRDNTILVSFTVVGARVEVDVFDDGHMEVSQFTGDEGVEGGLALALKIIDSNTDTTCE